jgi:lipopolysaccharide export system protein LptA
MKNPFLLLGVCLSLGGVAGPATAEKSDRNKPMNIEADALRYDDTKQVSVFTGRVVLTKGSIVIRGGQVEVRQDAEGFQSGLITGAADTPAFFRQKREGVDEFIEGQGDSIEYDGRSDSVKFIKHAQLRRYRGAMVADEITGALIVYDNLHDQFSVDGSSSQAATSPAGGRVRAMMTPKPDGAATPAPSPAGQPGPALRTTPVLEGMPK